MFARRREPDPQDLLPLKPIELLILTMLSAGARHGYGIRQDIVAHTEGRIALEAGNLYRHVRTLEADGVVQETDTPDEGDERRILYELTPFGRRVLAAELLRLRALLRLAEERRIIAPARV